MSGVLRWWWRQRRVESWRWQRAVKRESSASPGLIPISSNILFPSLTQLISLYFLLQNKCLKTLWQLSDTISPQVTKSKVKNDVSLHPHCPRTEVITTSTLIIIQSFEPQNKTTSIMLVRTSQDCRSHILSSFLSYRLISGQWMQHWWNSIIISHSANHIKKKEKLKKIAANLTILQTIHLTNIKKKKQTEAVALLEGKKWGMKVLFYT